MRAKAAFVVGAGIGYVLGTRAGRPQYERIVRASRAVWSHPLVHKPISGLESRAAELAREQSAAMIDHLAEAAKNLLRQDAASTSRSGARTVEVPLDGQPLA